MRPTTPATHARTQADDAARSAAIAADHAEANPTPATIRDAGIAARAADRAARAAHRAETDARCAPGHADAASWHAACASIALRRIERRAEHGR